MNPERRPGSPGKLWKSVAAGLLVGLVGFLFFYRIGELPVPHGDERSFLDVPYRFANFGDLAYPVFISESFGSADLRLYPPILALTVRSVALRVAGFSATNSRIFSACLILIVLLVAALWLRTAFATGWPLTLFALAPAAMTPAILIAARSTRLEQETFFFGALSALLLATGEKGGFTPRLRWLVLSGVFAAMASGMHPFGVVYGALAGVAVLLTRRAKTIVPWLGGAILGAMPTLWWMVAKGQAFADFTTGVGRRYQEREVDLVEWMARFPTVSWLAPLDLPDQFLARLASIQHAAYMDYVGFPVPPGWLGLALRFLFWAEVLVLVHFLWSHLRARHTHHAGVAWLAFLGLGFIVFNFAYVPNTTYGIYAAFHIHLAFMAVCLASQGRAWLRGLFAAVGLGFVTLGIASAINLITSPQVLTLDHELQAIDKVARASGIDRTDTVMTSTESWIAAGRSNTSLFERIHYDSPANAHQALVYRRSHLEFFLWAGLPRNSEARDAVSKQRRDAVLSALEGQHLVGLLILDEAQKDAVYFFRRQKTDDIVTASIGPAGEVLQTLVKRDAESPGPRVACDQALPPLCTLHEP